MSTPRRCRSRIVNDVPLRPKPRTHTETLAPPLTALISPHINRSGQVSAVGANARRGARGPTPRRPEVKHPARTITETHPGLDSVERIIFVPLANCLRRRTPGGTSWIGRDSGRRRSLRQAARTRQTATEVMACEPYDFILQMEFLSAHSIQRPRRGAPGGIGPGPDARLSNESLDNLQPVGNVAPITSAADGSWQIVDPFTQEWIRRLARRG